MTIGEYIKDYTSGSRITFWRFLDEIRELLIEIIKFNRKGIKEEFGDSVHFLQLWMFWRFGLNGQIWKASQHSIDKFIKREEVWKKIYTHVGLRKDISNCCQNYKKVEKVIKHLRQFDIHEEKAREAYRKVALDSQED